MTRFGSRCTRGIPDQIESTERAIASGARQLLGNFEYFSDSRSGADGAFASARPGRKGPGF